MARKKRAAAIRKKIIARKKVITKNCNYAVPEAFLRGWVHCPICSKRYSRRAIVEHMESNHSPELYRLCRGCGEPIQRGKRNLLRHLRECHPSEYSIVLQKRRDVREGKLGTNPDGVGKLPSYKEGWTSIYGEILTGTPGSGKKR